MIVKGEGNYESKIWFIGEAPGSQEEKIGRPFVGGAGRVLDSILSEAKIERGQAYIDNIIQERPSKNDFGVYYKDKGRKVPTGYLIEAHERVKYLIKAHQPNLVCALGNEVLFALTGRKNIFKLRGSILEVHGVKLIPMVDPSIVMRQYEFKPMAVLDMRRAKREMESPAFPTPYNDDFNISPTFEQVIDKIAELHNKEYLTFDIETAQNQILCIGFGWSKSDAVCIPIFYSGNSWWTTEQEFTIIKAIRELFLNPSVKFIAQNAQYDMIYLADKWGVEVTNLWMDTMVAFHCVYPELKKGLDFLCSIYTNRPYYKDMPGTGGPDVLWKYNCLDTVTTYECAMEIRKELKEFGTLDFYKNHSHKLIKPLIKIQRRGIRINLRKRADIDNNIEASVIEMQQRLTSAVGYDLNPNSPKQMKKFLYEDMKFPPQRNRKTGKLSANEDAIKTLARRFSNPIFDLILDIRKARKLLSTYIRAKLDNDGRIRCSYVITGTKTGRLASRESVYRSGTNLQNIPRGELIRSIFLADDNYRLVNADLSQAEARVVAYVARDEHLQILFEEPASDIHTKNAAMVFGKKIKKISPQERQLAKTLVHAANYGVGDGAFSKHIGSSINRARGLLNQYYALYPGIKRWHLEVKEWIRKSRVMTTPLGRKRTFFGRWGPDLIREAIAYVPQSTVSDVLNLGIIRASEHLPQGWELLMQNHDAIMMQVPIETDDMHLLKFIKHYFEIELEVEGKRFKIPVDIKTGLNWADMKKLELNV